MSEQQLMDCSYALGNNACQVGVPACVGVGNRHGGDSVVVYGEEFFFLASHVKDP
jgi:hypothetical protein